MSSEFTLLGHECPLGEYPSIVVPVGRVRDQLVVIYWSPKGSEMVPVPGGLDYLEHSEEMSARLRDFDEQRNGLFALSNEDIKIFVVGREGEFLSFVFFS
jgi:hypothetical protein